MKKRYIILISSVAILMLLSCSSQQAAGDFPYGSYLYRSYNFLGDLVGEGTLYINQSDSNTITGNWQIKKMRECLNCGAQFGTGVLTGYIENDTMYIDLNPDIVDITTELIGRIADGSFTGDWQWFNQAGFGYSGTFKAFRQ